ncbi:MAG: hypothetical protein KC731_00415, partial [Myxococcales bacterium]|nr:hypothetical protein [Myxococcales bacterium]
SYEDISSLGLFGGKPTVVVSSSQDRPILQRLGEPALVLVQSGRGPRAWFDERGAIVATTDWPANGKEAQVVVARVNQRGAASWTRRLGIAGEVSDDPRIVAGEGAALVTWERRTPSYDEELCWVVVDDAKGSTRQKADVCIPEAEGYVGVGRVGETFLIAHHRRRGHARGEPELLLLGDGVAPKAVALPTGSVGGGMDLAVVADREVGLVAEKDGAIVWTKLGPDGHVLRGPKVLSRGRDNRKPRITWAHGVFVVAWEIFPGDRAVAVAVDRFGHVSSSLELFPGQDPSTVAVAPAKHGFWATAVSGYHALVFGELACASQPSRLAPDRIAIP